MKKLGMFIIILDIILVVVGIFGLATFNPNYALATPDKAILILGLIVSPVIMYIAICIYKGKKGYV